MRRGDGRVRSAADGESDAKDAGGGRAGWRGDDVGRVHTREGVGRARQPERRRGHGGRHIGALGRRPRAGRCGRDRRQVIGTAVPARTNGEAGRRTCVVTRVPRGGRVTRVLRGGALIIRMCRAIDSGATVGVRCRRICRRRAPEAHHACWQTGGRRHRDGHAAHEDERRELAETGHESSIAAHRSQAGRARRRRSARPSIRAHHVAPPARARASPSA